MGFAESRKEDAATRRDGERFLWEQRFGDGLKIDEAGRNLGELLRGVTFRCDPSTEKEGRKEDE